MQAHDHGAILILLFEDNMELFAEADRLFAGHEVDIRAHLTFLEEYSPAEKGILYTRIVQGQDVPDWEPLELAHPGVFTGVVKPNDPGTCDFQFMYKEEGREVVFTMKSIKVYSHDDELPADPEHGDEAIFTKEQAWKTDFGLLPLETKEFSRAIHSSGVIIAAPSSEVEIISPVAGKVTFNGTELNEGTFVKQGTVLFTLLSTGLSHDNILLELNTAKTEYEKSKADMERKEELLKIEAVSRREYEVAKATFDQDKARFDVLQSQVGESGIVVKSPVSGYITEILCATNSFAETGTVLLKLVKDDGLLLKANVPVIYASSIKSICTANIKYPDSPNVHSIQEWDGRLVSSGRIIDPQTGMIPVFFSIEKSEFLPGTFVEIWLLTDSIPDQIVIPGSSLIEEYGQYYVYVQEEGETYEKRAIRIAEGDGINYQVLSGLEAGEVIVSKGGMAIKLANAMGAAPVHSH